MGNNYTVFVGRRLRLARALRKTTQKQLAEEVSVSTGLLSQLEHGGKEPQADLIIALGEVLGFDTRFFFTPLNDELTEEECSFRRPASTSKKLRSQALAQGTLISELVSCLRQKVKMPSVDVPYIPVKTSDDAEQAARTCRKHWQIGMDAPILTIGRLAERAGVVLNRFEPGANKIDAFCRWGAVPLIVLSDDKNSGSRRRFDIAHELGHLVMHRHDMSRTDSRERQANRFAAALLLPRDGFTRDFLSLTRLEWPYLLELKRHWHVSLAAIVHRAYELDLISAVTYRRLYKQLYSRGWNKAEPGEPKLEQPELLQITCEKVIERSPNTMFEVTRELGWTAHTLSKIAGVSVPFQPEAEIVISLTAYRQRRNGESGATRQRHW